MSRVYLYCPLDDCEWRMLNTWPPTQEKEQKLRLHCIGDHDITEWVAAVMMLRETVNRQLACTHDTG